MKSVITITVIIIMMMMIIIIRVRTTGMKYGESQWTITRVQSG